MLVGEKDVTEEIDKIADWLKTENRGSYLFTQLSNALERQARLDFAARFLSNPNYLQALINCIDKGDYKTRHLAIRMLLLLAAYCPKEVQDRLVQMKAVFTTLVEMIQDYRDIIRYDGILALILLSRGNVVIQKGLAFQDTFHALLSLIETEEGYRGDANVDDCVILLKTLVENNPSNLNLFIADGCVRRLSSWFKIVNDEPSQANAQQQNTIVFTQAQRTNFIRMLSFVRCLVAGKDEISNKCRAEMIKGQDENTFLHHLTKWLLVTGVDKNTLADVILCIGECIRGHHQSQDFFYEQKAPVADSPPLLKYIVNIMDKANIGYELRMAALIFVEAYLHKNDNAVKKFIDAIKYGDSEGIVGSVVLAGLFNSNKNDPIHIWCSCTVGLLLVRRLNDSEKTNFGLLKMPGNTQFSNPELADKIKNVLNCTVDIAFRHSSATAQFAALEFLCGLLIESAELIREFLNDTDNVPLMMNVLEGAPREGFEHHLLVQGIVAFMFAICVIFNDDESEKYPRKTLLDLLKNRMGGGGLLYEKICYVTLDEFYCRAVKNRHYLPESSKHLYISHEFAVLFKSWEDKFKAFFEHEADPSMPDPMTERKKIRELKNKLSEVEKENKVLKDKLVHLDELKSKQELHEAELKRETELRIKCKTLEEQLQEKERYENEYKSLLANFTEVELQLRRVKYENDLVENELKVLKQHLHELQNISQPDAREKYFADLIAQFNESQSVCQQWMTYANNLFDQFNTCKRNFDAKLRSLLHILDIPPPALPFDQINFDEIKALCDKKAEERSLLIDDLRRQNEEMVRKNEQADREIAKREKELETVINMLWSIREQQNAGSKMDLNLLQNEGEELNKFQVKKENPEVLEEAREMDNSTNFVSTEKVGQYENSAVEQVSQEINNLSINENQVQMANALQQQQQYDQHQQQFNQYAATSPQQNDAAVAVDESKFYTQGENFNGFPNYAAPDNHSAEAGQFSNIPL